MESEPDEAAAPWSKYAAVGGLVAGVLLLALAIAGMVRRRGPRPLRARDVFHMPAQVDGFVVVQLLRRLGSSELVRMTDAQRAEIPGLATAKSELADKPEILVKDNDDTPQRISHKVIARAVFHNACRDSKPSRGASAPPERARLMVGSHNIGPCL